MNKTAEEVKLPDNITTATEDSPHDLVLVSIPKMGKSVLFGDFTRKYNALVLDLEKGGYDYVDARKLSTYTSQDLDIWDSYENYLRYRKLLIESKGKYDYLLIDGLSDLDALAEIGGTHTYMNSIIGKKFNRKNNIPDGEKLTHNDAEWKSVLTLPEGAGYLHTRTWFMQQVEFFRQISPYRIYAAHIMDKYIKDGGKEQVVGSEIALTGQLKRIFASRVTALAKLTADGNERWLNFDVQNESIVAGSRSPVLKGRILISKMGENSSLTTYWENIYK